MKLTVDRIQDRTRVLGPGTRAAVWFHGCHRNCPGCIAAEMNRSDDFEVVEPKDLASRILSIDGIEGVTLSGGEPFDQDGEALLALMKSVKSESDLSIMMYTGYAIEELRERNCQHLAYVDILVDGPYVLEEDHGELWRGSSNQRFHFLTERYVGLAGNIDVLKGRKLELEFQEGLRFAFTGLPPKGFRQNLKRTLSEKGMYLDL